jgi:sulfur relay (sulfurtransferase) complex TusBCD TusD component (DsrE family)
MADLEGLKAKGASTAIIVNNDGMGTAEEALRHKLLRVYITMLQENNLYPGAVCFYASGVKMAVEGSPVLDLLKALEAKGTRIILCSTCLQYFGLSDKVTVGIVGGMSDILLAQWMADKVITL